MPRSSRHKSKRSVKEGREYSDTEEDASSKGKRREGKESGEKTKLKDSSVSGHGNGYSSDEYVGSKKRRERSDNVGSDRWNGSGEAREESCQFDEGKVFKLKGLIDLKSKISSLRHDGEMKEGNVDLFVCKEESMSGKVESKRRLEREVLEKEKLDRDSSRNVDSKYKDSRDKEKVSERDSRSTDSKRDLDYRAAEREELNAKKGLEDNEYGKPEPDKESDHRKKKRIGESDDRDKYQDRDRDSSDVNVLSRRDRVKDGSDRDERHKDITHRDKLNWPLEEVYGKHESEKERETRRRKRTSEADDDKDSTDINLTSRHERSKDGRNRDKKYRVSGNRDKNREYYDRDGKSKDVDKREGKDRERTHKYDEYSDGRAYAREELDSLRSREKKSRNDGANIDGSVVYDDQRTKYKDVKEARGSMDKQDNIDMKPRGAKEYPEASNSAGAKEESVPEREISLSFHPEESAADQSRRRRSPSTTALVTRDHYRHSKQSDTKQRESLPEERYRSNLNYGKEGNGSGSYDRAHSSRAKDKSVPKGDSGNGVDLSAEQYRITDRRVSPVRLADKPQSPSSADRRHLGRVGDRRNFDYEDSGYRSGGYKESNFHYHDGKRSRDRRVEAPSMNASSQADGDNMHVSSSFSRSSRTPGNSRLFHPPVSPLKHGTEHSYGGSAEEEGRGKLNNHPKRSNDSMGRMPGNSWWGAPNWPSPMGNGYMPFPHGPGPVGFHPMMQQFPPQMFGGRPPLDQSGVPFQVPDGDRFSGYGRPFGWTTPVDETCPSPMPNWDSNNMVAGEGFNQGRADWDQKRNLTASASREPSVDRYKSGNSAILESPSSNLRANAESTDDLSSQSNPSLKNETFRQIDQAANEDNFGGKSSSDASAPPTESTSRVFKAKALEEGKKNVDKDDHIHRSYVYLSKIDISADLAPSDLFDQCVSLLGIKLNNLSDTRVSIFSLKEENDEVKSAKMNTYTSRVPVFPEVSDSLLEKAMSLYRQHRDETAVNYSSSTGNHVRQSPETQGSEPPSPAPSQLDEVNGQELVCPGPLNEPEASINNEDKDTTPINHLKLEGLSPVMCDKLDVEVSCQPEVATIEVSASEELIPVVDTDAADNSNTVLDEEKSVQSPNTVTIGNAAAKHDATTIPLEEADDSNKETDGQQQAAIEKTSTTGLPSSTSVGLELNECGSVNLSRIH